MKIFAGNNVPGLYTDILREILLEGKEVGPRGMKTKELSPVCIEVTDPRRRLFGHPHRRDVSVFTYIEGLWILRGEANPERVAHYAKAIRDFVNPNTGLMDGAYGPRIRKTPVLRDGNGFDIKGPSTVTMDQFKIALFRLTKDPDTRQAVVIIHNPVFDWNNETKDLPCTLTFQFLLRDKKLDMIVNMRSQDAWWGFVYDTGEFQWFQEIMAGWLGVGLGRYIHIDGSLHLYERDWVKAQEVVDQDFNFSIYDQAEILDARVGKKDYDAYEGLLARWETACRTNIFAKEDDEFENWGNGIMDSDFYCNLMDVILAYNLRLRGEKDEAYEIVRNNKSDLGLIYEQRWRP